MSSRMAARRILQPCKCECSCRTLSTLGREIILDPHQRCPPPAAFRVCVGKLFAAYSSSAEHRTRAPSKHIRPRRPDVGRDQVLIGAQYPYQLCQLPEPFHIATELLFPRYTPLFVQTSIRVISHSDKTSKALAEPETRTVHSSQGLWLPQ